MENRAHALAAGLFTIAFGLLLAVAAYWFSGEHAAEDTYVLVSKFSVSGLSVQGEVRYRGLQVGHIKKIEIDPAARRTILIHVSIKRGTPITTATFARLAYQGVTGLSYVQLDDDGKVGQPLESRKGALARIEVRSSLLEDVSESGQVMISRINDVSLRVSRLLSDQNLERLNNTLANAEAISAKLDTIPAMAADARLTLKRADTLIANLDTLTKALNQRVGIIDRMSESAERLGKMSETIGNELSETTLPKLEQTLDNANRATGKLESLLDQPQSLIFGKPEAAPGPGEPGFAQPY